MTRATTRQAIEFTGVIEGSDDNQWIVADAIRDVDTQGQGGLPRHRWTVSAGTNDEQGMYYTARAQGVRWHAFAPSAQMLAQAIRVGFPRALRRDARSKLRDTDAEPRDEDSSAPDVASDVVSENGDSLHGSSSGLSANQ
jgi:hypothetical protein